MFRTCMLVASILTTSFAFAEEELNQPPEGFKLLFNGRDLSGWRGIPPDTSPYKIEAMSDDERAQWQQKANEELHKHWRVQDGILINDGHGPYLATEKDFGDVEFYIDWKIVPGGDSGIYLRGTPQVQIWDTTEAGGKWISGAKHGSGSLWNNKKTTNKALVHADNPPGQWNTFHITMKGDRVSVELNGKLVVDDLPLENYWDPKKPLPEKGPIQLQTHGGEIHWRNIFFRELQ